MHDPSIISPARPIPRYKVYQTSVYTSYKNDTSKSSYRYQMYEDMKQLGGSTFRINTMETVGKSEKCVDIQLAVDMLHLASKCKLSSSFASNSNTGSVDENVAVAVLLSGDKDFKPAMIRTRQMGMKIALSSMKRGCNRALYTDAPPTDYTSGSQTTSSSILDYPNVIWLEDHLDQLVHVKPPTPGSAGTGASIINQTVGPSVSSELDSLSSVSLYTITKVINDFIVASECKRVNSRDMGRYLKRVVVPTIGSILHVIKVCHGGLRQFLSVSGNLYVLEDCQFKQDAFDKAYWISFRNKDAYDEMLKSCSVSTKLSPAETVFFEKFYSIGPLQSNYEAVYQRTLLEERQLIGTTRPSAIRRSTRLFLDEDNDDDDEEISDSSMIPDRSGLQASSNQNPSSDKQSYWESCSVAQLKAELKGKGLPVSGRKADLIERLRKSAYRTDGETSSTPTDAQNHLSSRDKIMQSRTKNNNIDVDPDLSGYLQSLMKEFLQANGGEASSRNIGRYLAANKSLRFGESQSALDDLKVRYGSLAAFLHGIQQQHENSGNPYQIVRIDKTNQHYTDSSTDGKDSSRYVFFVRLVNQVSYDHRS
jgi:SAP domain